MSEPETRVVFEHAGGETAVRAQAGQTLMGVATRAGIPGVVGECGGTATCATCHVYVEAEYLSRIPPPSEQEDEMLDEAWEPRRTTSRLGCQVEVISQTPHLRIIVAEGAE